MSDLIFLLASSVCIGLLILILIDKLLGTKREDLGKGLPRKEREFVQRIVKQNRANENKKREKKLAEEKDKYWKQIG